MAIRVRTLTDEERRTIENLAHSRTATVRQVERAKIIFLAAQGRRVAAIAHQVGMHEQTVRDWIKRFNVQGLTGLQDRPRPGKPPTYTADERSEVIVTALTNPLELEQPFACWTLDRLQVYLNEHKGIGIKRTRIDELLIAEGLRWRQQETWFSEKAQLDTSTAKPERPLDTDFAQKRGPSKPSTRPRLRIVS
jgi:transposase